MKNMVQRGHSMTVTAAAAVKSGDLVITGAIPGVAYTDAAIGEEFEVSIVGVFELPKVTGAINHGVKVYWDATEKKVTVTSASNTPIGHAFAAALSAAVIAQVKLTAF